MPSMQLRSYQTRIVREAAKGGNTIAVLPTGSGKTLIAAELVKVIGPPAVFFVPTCLLVEQQAKAVRDWTGLNVGEYMGGATLPSRFDVLVSTPKAFQIAQARGIQTLQWTSLRLVIFDEVHHVLKDHPYRKLALQLSQNCSSSPAPCILGLSASLTYAVGQKQVEAAVSRICAELRIKVMATATETEMRDSGYFGTRAEAIVNPVVVPDAGHAGVVPPAKRKPHLMHKTFFDRIKTGIATRASADLYAVVIAMEGSVAQHMAKFESPLKNASLKSWGEQAHAGRPNPMCGSLEHWYEALRALVVSWEEAEDAAVTFLRMCREDSMPQQQLWPAAVREKIDAFWARAPSIFPRFEHLKDMLLYQHDDLAQRSKEFRGLLFVQQRVTTHILEHFISSDEELALLFRPSCIYATASPATPSLSVSAAESKRRLAEFASGAVNLLITTVVAEEGMDVPAANCVVSFDPMLNSVSLVQRRGRARQEHSAFVVLSERDDRTAANLAEVEKQQLDIVRNFNPHAAVDDTEAQLKAQRSREVGARSVLASATDPTSALAALNLYCKKTKVELAEEHVQREGRWICTLRYSSVLRSVSEMAPQGDVPLRDGKKDSKRRAALKLLAALQADLAHGA